MLDSQAHFRLSGVLPGWDNATAQPASNAAGRIATERVVGVLPGEGIGPEVMEQAVKVLRAVASTTQTNFDIRFGGPIGRAAEEQGTEALSPSVIDFCEDVFDKGGAILCGPGGGRFVYDLRARFALYCKFTPIRPNPALDDAGVLRPEARQGVNLVVVRENSGGIYFGRSSVSNGAAHHEFSYDAEHIRPILQAAIGVAEQRCRRLALVIKPYGVPAVSQLWLEQFEAMTAGRGLETRVLEVDNAGYQIVANAHNFDVLVAPNLFGDILSDVAAVLLGSRGLSYSGNFAPGRVAVYQTGHGAAYDIAGKQVANPVGQILAVAMMLRQSFGLYEAAAVIEAAIQETLAAGVRTADMAGPDSVVVDTLEMGTQITDAVSRQLINRATPPLPAQICGKRLADEQVDVPAARIDGRWLPGTGRNAIVLRKPSDWSETCARVPVATLADIESACDTALKAQRTWRSQPTSLRTTLLDGWADAVADRADELAVLLTVEIGKPLREAQEEIRRAIGHIRSASRLAQERTSHQIDEPQRHVQVRYKPHGVVGVITPWNNPLAIPVGKIAPALALGNAVVWKPAAESPRAAIALMETLDKAGVAPGLVDLVFGDARTASFVIDNAAVSAVSFTGSTAAGRLVVSRCGRRAKPAQVELGGNNAAIVLEDADFWQKADGMARAAFSFAGQRCTAIRRFIVQRSILPQFEQAFVDAVRELRVGDPGDPDVDVGPLISLEDRQRVRRLLVRAESEGAHICCGGTVPDGLEHGCWLAPAVLSDVSPTMSIARHETFGPVAVILAAESLDEAIEIANGVEQGLLAAIYTRNPENRRRFAAEVEAGILRMCSIGPLNVHPEAPFAGWKASGLGPPKHGPWDLQFYSRPQAIYGWEATDEKSRDST